MRFYQRATVADPDSPGAHFTFDLGDPAHAACFNVGVGPDGGTLISWSPLHALYTLPDGTAWAEHSNLWDADDLVRARHGYCHAGRSWRAELLVAAAHLGLRRRTSRAPQLCIH